MGPAIAQGAEIALSGHDRADAAGDAAVLTPGIGPAAGDIRAMAPDRAWFRLISGGFLPYGPGWGRVGGAAGGLPGTN